MKASIVLREARRRAGMTQADLAKAGGVKQPTISRIESGAVVPSVDTLDRLLRACGESLEALPLLGIGVDRTLFRRWVGLSPTDRLRVAEQDSRNLTRLLRSAKS